MTSTGRSVGTDGVPIPANLHQRAEWAGERGPVGPLRPEDDVRFLLVHHTVTPNGYTPDAVAPRLRNIFDYHTGTKGWSDVAYNFMVDAQGRIWETRAGSIAGPVRGDATGGSQGFAILCCFLGDHSTEPPTDAAVDAMVALLAWQADLHDIDLSASSEITFISRGSDRWAEGSTVTTGPIAGHRDMSYTECPGDAAHRLVLEVLQPRARDLVERSRPAPTTTTSEAAVASAPPTTATTPAPTTSTTSASSRAPTTSGPPPESSSASGNDKRRALLSGFGATATTAALGGLVWLRRRRDRGRPMAGSDEPDRFDDDLWTG